MLRQLEDDLFTNLTERQEQILDYLEDCVAENGYPPTRAEVAAKFGFKSPNAAEEHLRALARKKRIQLVPGISRGIKLLDLR